MSSFFLPQRKFTFLRTGGLVVKPLNISIRPVLHLRMSITVDDEKWVGKLKAVGMAQGTYAMESITSAKFRVFLAEKGINYLYIANVGANILLTNTNIGCPNISFGPSSNPLTFFC